MTRRIAVLNSYNLPRIASGRQTLRVQAFVRALADAGLDEGRDYELVLVDHEDPEATAAATRRLVAEGVDLFHAIGTPNTVAAATATREVPIVYYGAHPEGIAEAVCAADNLTGRVFALPFTSSYKNFRFLRRFLPHVRTVWTPFYEGTVFVRPEMRRLHRAARNGAGRPRWLSGGDGEVGFQTLAGLGYVIDVEYRELVFASAEELAEALEEPDPADGVLMPYNESFHCPGAVETIFAVSRERRLPVIWNNNAQVAVEGVLSGIGADWELLGRESGEAAAAILAGAPPSSLPRALHRDQVAWINLDAAERLGLDLGEDALSYFDRRVSDGSRETCM